MRFLMILFILVLTSCSTQKKVFICGDHECINKDEAEMYFEKNLSIEVKITENKKEKFFNLVKLNNEKSLENDKKKIKVIKSKKKREVRKLSRKEILKKKEEIKIKNREINKAKKIEKKTKSKKKLISKKNIIKNKEEKKVFEMTEYKNVCTILKKCNIEEIAQLLIKQGNIKDYPNLNKR